MHLNIAMQKQQERELKVRDEKIAGMEKQLAELAARDKEREARLARIEQFIPVPEPSAAPVARR